MYRKVKNIKEFRSLLLASLSSEELSIVGSCVKRVCGSNRLENHLRRVSTRRRVNRGSVKSGWCFFPLGSLKEINITTKISHSLDLLLPKITRLYYSAFHNFKKLEPFINAGSGLVFQKICLKYITVLYLKENCK